MDKFYYYNNVELARQMYTAMIEDGLTHNEAMEIMPKNLAKIVEMDMKSLEFNARFGVRYEMFFVLICINIAIILVMAWIFK